MRVCVCVCVCTNPGFSCCLNRLLLGWGRTSGNLTRRSSLWSRLRLTLTWSSATQADGRYGVTVTASHLAEARATRRYQRPAMPVSSTANRPVACGGLSQRGGLPVVQAARDGRGTSANMNLKLKRRGLGEAACTGNTRAGCGSSTVSL